MAKSSDSNLNTDITNLENTRPDPAPAPELSKAAQKGKRVKVVSRARFPVKFTYNEQVVMIAPQGRVENLDPALLVDELPTYLTKVEYDLA